MPRKRLRRSIQSVCSGVAVATVLLLAGCSTGTPSATGTDTGTGTSTGSTTGLKLDASIPADQVVATFKGGKVTYAEMVKQYNVQRGLAYPTESASRAQLTNFLKRYIAEYRVLGDEAKAAHITGEASDVTPLVETFKSGLVQQTYSGDQNQLVGRMQDLKVTDKDITQWATTTVALDAYARSKADKVVPESMAKKYYNDNPVKFTQGTVDQILVASQADADKVASQLKAGSDFTTLAKKVSIDPSVQQNGGAYTNVHFDSLATEVAVAALGQPIGIVGPPIRSDYGWFIVKVIQRSSIPFAQVDQPIRMEVVQQRTQTELETLVADKEKVSDIHITLPNSIK